MRSHHQTLLGRGCLRHRLPVETLAILTIAAALTGAPDQAHAWGRNGHRIVCEIAQERLGLEAKQLITTLQSGESKGFNETCLWADSVRKTTHKYSKDYHYTNIPAGKSGVDLDRDCQENEGSCSTWAIDHYAKRLADTQAPRFERNEALKFLAHFVGDLHQPLHCGRPGDIGGNVIKTCFFGYCGTKKNPMNLHNVWDTSVIYHREPKWRTLATELDDQITTGEASTWSDSDYVGWTNESYRIADEFAYPRLTPNGIWTSYYNDALPHVELRLKQAGVRLAHLLNSAATGTLSTSTHGEKPSTGHVSCEDGECIEVASFNIKYLGKGDREMSAVHAIADLISEELGLEVVVLQEINTESDQWKWMKERLATRGYEFFEGKTSERKQFVVIAWNENSVKLVSGSKQQLEVKEGYEKPGEPKCKYQGLRVPIAAQFIAGDFDFWVVGVHLKSRSRGRPPNKLPRGCPAWIRERQAEDLIEDLDRLIKGSQEEDVLLVGDFNEAEDHDSLRPIRMAGFKSQMKYRSESSGDCSYLPGCPEIIDHVWLPFSETQELVRRSGFVFAPDRPKAFLVETSDHVPVWASFRTDQDLDKPDP